MSEFNKAVGDEWLWGNGSQPRAGHISIPYSPQSVLKTNGKTKQTFVVGVSGWCAE